MLVAKAKTTLFVGYDDDNVLVPGLVTYSEESENKDENCIHLEGFLNQAYLDCSAHSDIRNNLAGVYLMGDHDTVLEMRRSILKYRNVRENVLNRAAFRYGTSLVRELQAIIGENENHDTGIILLTDTDELYTLTNEESLGFAQHFLDQPCGPISENGYQYPVDGFDIYQIMALYAQTRTYELGYVPKVNPDNHVNICTYPFKK